MISKLYVKDFNMLLADGVENITLSGRGIISGECKEYFIRELQCECNCSGWPSGGGHREL